MHLSLEVGISETLLALDIAQLRPPASPHQQVRDMTRRQAVLQVAQTQRLLADRLDLPIEIHQQHPVALQQALVLQEPPRARREPPSRHMPLTPIHARHPHRRAAPQLIQRRSARHPRISSPPTQTHASKGPATATSTPAVDVTRKTIRPRPDASRAAPAAHQPGFSSSKDVAARRQLLSWFPRDAGPSAPLPRDAQCRQGRCDRGRLFGIESRFAAGQRERLRAR